MVQGLTFDDLMRRVEAGNQEAAAEVFRLYAHRLIALARKALDTRCRAMLSGSDVAEEVLNSFFQRQARDPYDVESDSALWALLTEIALRKCRKWNRHFVARKRGPGLVRSLQVVGEDGAGWDVAGGGPTPDDAAVLAETVAELYRGLKQNERAICEMRLQNYQVREIADRLNLSEETVSRKLGRIKDKLQRLCAAGE
jgi:RNA polymerase sigma-70 factor, ECF subfamily